MNLQMASGVLALLISISAVADSVDPQPHTTAASPTSKDPPNPTTSKPPTTTTTKPPSPTPTPITTASPTTPTKPPTTSTTTPPPAPTTPSPTTPSPTHPSPTHPTPTPKPTPAPENRKFDGPSFIGGIVLTIGLLAIGFVSYKFYMARTNQSYHTL